MLTFNTIIPLLQLVLSALTKPPFEPIDTCNEKLLSLKIVFLVAITSAKRASELAALRSDAPYLQFHPGKVTLYFDTTFLPKVVSDFHMSQPIVLPTLFPSPSTPLERKLHTLDVRQALAFYIDRAKQFQRSPRLFHLLPWTKQRCSGFNADHTQVDSSSYSACL